MNVPIISTLENAGTNDFEHLQFEIVTMDGQRIPIACRFDHIGEIIWFLLACLGDAGASKHGGKLPPTPDTLEAKAFPYVRASLQALTSDDAGAIILDFGICKFAAPCTNDELRQILKNAELILAKSGPRQPH